MDKENTKKRVKYVVEHDKNYSVTSPTDAFGSLTPGGLLAVHLFTDIRAIPFAMIQDISKGKIVGNPEHEYDLDLIGKTELDNTVVVDRRIFGTILLQPDRAYIIAKWIVQSLLDAYKVGAIKMSKELIKKDLEQLIVSLDDAPTSTQKKPKKKTKK